MIRIENDYSLPPEQRERILRQNWISHDGQWFLKTALELGFEKANRLNHSAVASMGHIEMRRLMKASDVEKIENMERFLQLITLASELYFPEEHLYEIKVIDPHTLAGEVKQCFVYQLVNRVEGAWPHFHCAAVRRFQSWMEVMGLKGEVRLQKVDEDCRGRCQILFHVAEWLP